MRQGAGGMGFKIVCLFALVQTIQSVGEVCAQLVYGNFYDLGDLHSEKDMEAEVSNAPGVVIFNMCKYVNIKCPGYNNSYAIYKEEDKCIPLTTDSIIGDFNSTLMPISSNETNETAGLNITFNGVSNVTEDLGNQLATFNLQLYLDCNFSQDAYSWNYKIAEFFPNNGTFRVYGIGKDSCPEYSTSFLIEFFNRFSYILAAVAIVLGAIQCFYGVRIFKTTMFIVGFLFGFLVTCLLLFGVWTGQDTPTYKGYVIMSFAAVTGIMIGFLIASIAWVGLVMSGSVLGFFLGMFIYSAAFFKVTSYPPNLLLYNTLAISMVIGSIAGYEFQSEILILSCAFTGAYMIVRGVSAYLGGFPNEFSLAHDFKTGIYKDSSKYLYPYFAAIGILTLIGIYIQRRLERNDRLVEAKNARLRYKAAKGELYEESDEEEELELPELSPKQEEPQNEAPKQ